MDPVAVSQDVEPSEFVTRPRLKRLDPLRIRRSSESVAFRGRRRRVKKDKKNSGTKRQEKKKSAVFGTSVRNCGIVKARRRCGACETAVILE